MNTRQLAAKHGIVIGCGDSSCIFGSPGGQHTNGGCRCLRGVGNWTREEQWEVRTLVRDLVKLINLLTP